MPNTNSTKAPNKWEGTHTYPRGGTQRRRTVAQFQEDAAARIKADREKRRIGVEKLRRNSIAGLPAPPVGGRSATVDIDIDAPDTTEDATVEEVFFDASGEEMPGSNKKKRQASGAAPPAGVPMDQASTGQPPGVDPAMLELLMSIKKDINDTTRDAVDKIDRRIDENAKAIQKVGEQTAEEMRKLREHCQENQTKFEERIERQLDVREQKMERRLLSLEVRASSPGTRTQLRTGKQDAAYLEARRTLKLWPVSGEDLEDSVRTFLQTKLKVGEERIRSLGKIAVRSGLGKAARDRCEVLATFDSREDRDYIKSLGINLAGLSNVGMSLHVPGHLLDNFYALNSIGYNIKRNQEGIKRSIKFDDSIQDIYLDIFIGGKWQKILPAQARAALKASPATAASSSGAGISSEDLVSLVQGDMVPGITAVVVPGDGDASANESSTQDRET